MFLHCFSIDATFYEERGLTMGRKKQKRKKRIRNNWTPQTDEEALTFSNELSNLKQKNEKMSEAMEDLQFRMEDAEIHINLLTRLLTTLCVEKLGMRIGVLKRLLKRIEKEAIRDSQILHLESLYNLPNPGDKKTSPSKRPKRNDPWGDIS